MKRKSEFNQTRKREKGRQVRKCEQKVECVILKKTSFGQHSLGLVDIVVKKGGGGSVEGECHTVRKSVDSSVHSLIFLLKEK